MDPHPLTETMTVNRVLREHPETKTVFERFRIDVMYEGYDCLDEVAWRRRLSAEQFLALLERAMMRPLHS